jgi:hypothetical protein
MPPAERELFKTRVLIRNDITRRYLCMLQEKTKNDICWFYHHGAHDIGIMNIKELKEQMKTWRKLALGGKIKIMDYNIKTKNIFNKEWHIFVIQKYEDGEHVPQNPDRAGCMLMGYVVSGYIYAFKKKENRDDVANYVMKGLDK